MAMELRGKAIAISGASSGIGAATALACARSGMDVALCARREDKLREVAERCRGLGVRAFTMGVDVADAGACRAFIEGAARELGGLYAVYANAGYGLEKPILEMSDAEMRAIFEVNFFGTLNLIRPAIEHFRAQPSAPERGGWRGHVLICSSCLARLSIPFYGAYAATKAAQAHVGGALRLELEPERIAVSTVHPITTRTELFDQVKTRSGLTEVKPHAPKWLEQDAEVVAACTLRCLRRPRPEVWTNFKGAFVRAGMSVCSLVPGLSDGAGRKMVAGKKIVRPDGEAK